MDIPTELRTRLDRLNSEHAILLLFIVVSAYMFVRAQEWGFNTKVFPQAMAGAVIVGSLLLLVQDYLPEPVRRIVAGSGGAFGRTEELEEEIEKPDGEREESAAAAPGYDRPLNPVLFTAILVVVYAAGGYLFSLLVMSPLFVAAYLVWFRQPWPIVVGISLLGLLIAYGFASLIIVPVDRGVLVGDLLTIGVMI